MSDKYTDILTPVGRLVGGDFFSGYNTDHDGNPLVFKSGANTGQPCTNYVAKVAFAKNDPAFLAMFAMMLLRARTDFPQLTFGEDGSCSNPKFSFKMVDGDQAFPNAGGNIPNTLAGYPGHWVISFSSFSAPQMFAEGGTGKVLTEKADILTGYFVRVAGSCSGNGRTDSPGIYMNIDAIERVAFGEVIAGGGSVDGKVVFGAAPVGQLPAGASTMPVASPNDVMGGANPMAQPQQQANPMAQPQQQANPMAASVQPDHSFAAVEVLYMTPSGAHMTVAQLTAANVPIEQILALPVVPF